MSFSAKDVGAVVEKYHIMNNLINQKDIISNRECSRQGFNDGIDAQASVKMGFNREKLARLIDYLQTTEEIISCEELADAIISAEKELIEVVK